MGNDTTHGVIPSFVIETVDLRSKKLKEVLGFDLDVEEIVENEKNKSVIAKLFIGVERPSAHRFGVYILFNYYGVHSAYKNDEQQMRTLTELNLKLIRLSVLEKFVELEAQNVA